MHQTQLSRLTRTRDARCSNTEETPEGHINNAPTYTIPPNQDRQGFNKLYADQPTLLYDSGHLTTARTLKRLLE